ncbi:unnamed protein product [Diplocarpon coronariae]|nr:hypothetical protein JHW43_000390 [Diplocarpon mali]
MLPGFGLAASPPRHRGRDTSRASALKLVRNPWKSRRGHAEAYRATAKSGCVFETDMPRLPTPVGIPRGGGRPETEAGPRTGGFPGGMIGLTLPFPCRLGASREDR